MPAQAQERPARAGPLRGIAALLGGALLLAALLILGRELIAAQVPQHRAALEEFIRHETGLEITFSRLSVRWGWYGPEAVFHSVVLGEPGGAGPLLSAPQLVVGLDAWRMVRSGQLEAGRITLVGPDVDLGSRAAAAPPAGGRAPAAAPPGLLGSGTDWRRQGSGHVAPLRFSSSERRVRTARHPEYGNGRCPRSSGSAIRSGPPPAL